MSRPLGTLPPRTLAEPASPPPASLRQPRASASARWARRWKHWRLKLARVLGRPLPDRAFLALNHLLYFGRWPDYAQPTTFAEKTHVYMLGCRDPLLHVAADKLQTREYVARVAGPQHLVPLLGVWARADEVPLAELPRPYVLKPSAASGQVLFIERGGWLDERTLRRTMRGWLDRDYSRFQREWCYAGLPRRILAERRLAVDGGAVPPDYKAYVLGKQVRFIQVDRDRFGLHTRNLYAPDWRLLRERLTLPNHAPDPRPACLDQLVGLAERLAAPFEFLRVDFYVLPDALYVGELTNYSGAGFERFIPASFSREVAAHWSMSGAASPDR